MLVYGQPEFLERFSLLLSGLRARQARTRPDDLDALRTLLIQTGQLEQAVEDGWPAHDRAGHWLLPRVARLTELAATAFFSLWTETSRTSFELAAQARQSLAELQESLAAIEADADPVLAMRVPEGFEFYSLYPEQYAESALMWARVHAGTWPKRAVVVGIRSIGTTLSAVVQAALESAGWQVERLTVRPTGHPYDRQVVLPKSFVCHRPMSVKCALVVDEGPGLSGSSMAAAGTALQQAGLADISFLAGHGNEPGAAAGPAVRRWWTSTPRFWTRLEELRWHGYTLAESLVARAETLVAPPSGREAEAWSIEDLGTGAWRSRVYPDEAEWPAVVAGFERAKLRCVAADGRALLWRFGGLGCTWRHGQSSTEAALEELAARVQAGWVAAPAGGFRGFVAVPWVPGKRLTPAEVQAGPVLAQMADYLVRSVGTPLAGAEAEAGVLRLEEMLYWNVREGLGEEWAERTRAWSRAAREAPLEAYGDGRLAPHEWVRGSEGRLCKTDCTGHDRDHSLVGRQSYLWDVAGLIVEGELGPEATSGLLARLEGAGLGINRGALRFYELAYAAFRMGISTFGAGQVGAEAAEHGRLQRAAERYGRMVRAGLS